MSRKSKIQKLHEALDKFLETEIKCTTDFCAPVSEEEFKTLYKIFDEIIDLKYQGNYEDERAVKVKLTNIHVHEREYFSHQFKLSDNPSSEEIKLYYRTAVSNLKILTHTLDRVQWILEDKFKEK